MGTPQNLSALHPRPAEPARPCLGGTTGSAKLSVRVGFAGRTVSAGQGMGDLGVPGRELGVSSGSGGAGPFRGLTAVPTAAMHPRDAPRCQPRVERGFVLPPAGEERPQPHTAPAPPAPNEGTPKRGTPLFPHPRSELFSARSCPPSVTRSCWKSCVGEWGHRRLWGTPPGSGDIPRVWKEPEVWGTSRRFG